MLKGTTASGFEFEIDEKMADDMELVEEIAEADKDVSKFPGVIRKMLGEEQKEKLYDHVRDKKTGRVPIKACVEIFVEIMNAASEETKN